MRGPALVVLLGLALAAPRVSAQVELDGSLGGTSGLVPGGALPDGTSATYLIQESYGRRSGPNLFHSFSRFDVPAAQSAAFTGDPAIERVIGRVTGGAISQIGGMVRNTIEGADLYLINPRGFLFTGAPTLDVRGSFYLSSADNLRFADGVTFGTAAVSGEVLSAAAPSAWGFTSTSAPGAITLNTPRNFAVPSGETIEVVGGNVSVRGTSGTPTLRAPGGTIALASRATPGEVPVDLAALSARDSATDELGRVGLTSASLDVSDPTNLSPARGRIVIRSGELIVDSSALRSGSAADARDDAPDIDLETTRSIQLRRTAGLDAVARGSARGGGVRISSESIALSGASSATTSASDLALAGGLEVDAGSLELSEGSRLATSAIGDATAGRIAVGAGNVASNGGAQIASLNAAATDAPSIEISVAGLLQLGSGASIVTQALGDGRGAALQIEAASLEQGGGARIESATFGTGAGGDVEVRVERAELAGDSLGADPGGVFASSFASGDAGDIRIEAQHVSVAGGAQISATAEGVGRGGDIEIEAFDTLQLSGASAAGPSGVFARSGLGPLTTATGDGGDIALAARNVSLNDRAEISTQTFGTGNAGGIQIAASESVEVAGGADVDSRASINAKAAVGAGGSIAIETEELRIGEGGDISASTLESGDSGDVTIDAARVFVGGGAESGAGPAGIFAQSIPTEATGIPGGDGGDIAIRATERVELSNGALVSAQTRGLGQAGNVRIVAPVVNVTGAQLSTQTFGSGAAGSVTLDGVDELIVGQGGSITSETLGAGLGGSVAIDAEQQVLVMNGGTISATSQGTGDAGSIAIDAGQRFSARNGGQVTTSAQAADGGDIEIRASRLIYIEDGRVTTDVRAGLGSGGNITLDPEFVVLNRAELRASAVGDGGNITIETNRLVVDSSSVIDASSELGIDGEIQTTSPTVDLTSELAQLDTTFLDASSKLAAACAARSGQRGTFAVRGRARAVSPEAPLGSTHDEENAPGCDEPKP